MAYNQYTSSNYYRPSPLGGFQYFPPVIKALLISNVAVYFLTGIIGLFRIGSIPVAAIINAYFPLYPIGNGFEVWQLFTYMFMHGGLMHLFMNMLALWMFGMELEHVWGSKRFFTYYMACGIGAGLCNLFIAPLYAAVGPTIGASGAIYGVLVAFGMLFPDRPVFLGFFLPIPAKFFVIMYIGVEVLAGVSGTSDGVAHFAHLGGAAVGFVYVLFLLQRNPFQGLWSRTRESIGQRERVNQYSYSTMTDAKFDDRGRRDEAPTQERIDEILDKISKSGYKSLTEEEKKILFNASKQLN